MKYFDYYSVKSVSDATDLKKKLKNSRYYAGGTDILVQIKRRIRVPAAVIDIKNIPGIVGIKETEKYIEIGAATTMNEISESDIVKRNIDVLAQCAREVGSYQIRNLATIGGNICNAAPSADISPALLVLNADIIIKTQNTTHTVNINEFFKGPGKTILTDESIVYKIKILKLPSGSMGQYIKESRVSAVDLAIVGVAVLAVPSQKVRSKYDVRVSLGSVAPTPIRVPEAEEILKESISASSIEKAASAAETAAKPISDIRASAEYRNDQVKILTKRALKTIFYGEVSK